MGSYTYPQRLKQIGKTALGLFLPWFAVLTFTAFLAHSWLLDYREEPLKQRQLTAVEMVSGKLYESVGSLGRDILFLSKHPVIRHYITLDAPTAADRDRVQDFLRVFSIANPAYAQIRWIGLDGWEKIRCDQINRNAFCLPPSDLQDKSARYYYKNALETPFGDLFFSPLDLNVERGQVEFPYVPTLRVATRVRDENGLDKGVLVINFHARDLLDSVTSIAQSFAIPIFLVDGAGHWLVGEQPGDAWSHQVGNREQTFATRYPDAWAYLTHHQSMDVRTENGFWIGRIFSLDRDGAALASEAVTSNQLVVIARLPLMVGEGLWRQTAIEVGAIYVLVLCIGMLLAWRLASANFDRQQALETVTRRGQQLSESNTMLTRTLQNLQDMQEDLVRAERLSSLGMMVAGIAHELNTPVGGAMMTLSTLQQRLGSFKADLRADQTTMSGSGSESAGSGRRARLLEFVSFQQEGLTIALDNVRRASSLIGTFKQLAVDRAQCDRRSFDVQDLLRDVLRACTPQLQKCRVVVELTCPEGLILDSYPGPLGQAVENLIRNVCDHAYGDGGGPLYITARQKRHMLVLVVEDTGKGIAEDQVRRVFDPFFTTRGAQEGHGLGLYLVYGFITETLGGKLSLKSVPGLGCRFTMELPFRAPMDGKVSPEKTADETNVAADGTGASASLAGKTPLVDPLTLGPRNGGSGPGNANQGDASQGGISRGASSFGISSKAKAPDQSAEAGHDRSASLSAMARDINDKVEHSTDMMMSSFAPQDTRTAVNERHQSLSSADESKNGNPPLDSRFRV